MKTDEEIQELCDDFGLGHWAWGQCDGANCAGGGVVEDTFDGLCRWCWCEEDRPRDPGDMPPPMRAEEDEWAAWLCRRLDPNRSGSWVQ